MIALLIDTIRSLDMIIIYIADAEGEGASKRCNVRQYV